MTSHPIISADTANTILVQVYSICIRNFRLILKVIYSQWHGFFGSMFEAKFYTSTHVHMYLYVSLPSVWYDDNTLFCFLASFPPTLGLETCHTYIALSVEKVAEVALLIE